MDFLLCLLARAGGIQPDLAASWRSSTNTALVDSFGETTTVPVLESLPPHLVKELQGHVHHPTHSAWTDQRAVNDHIGQESLLLHPIKALQGPLCHTALCMH